MKEKKHEIPNGHDRKPGRDDDRSLVLELVCEVAAYEHHEGRQEIRWCTQKLRCQDRKTKACPALFHQ